MLQLLTMQDVAEVLKISPQKAYKMAQGGEIPVVRFGRAVRMRQEDLEKFIQEKVEASV